MLRALGFEGVRLLSFDTNGEVPSDVSPFLEDLGVPLLSRVSLPNMFASHRMLLLSSVCQTDTEEEQRESFVMHQ